MNLPAWREFCGFDLTGQNAWFDIVPEADMGSVVLRAAEDRPFAFPKQLERLDMIFDPVQVKKAAPAEGVLCDITGAARPEGDVMPGPFADWGSAADGLRVKKD